MLPSFLKPCLIGIIGLVTLANCHAGDEQQRIDKLVIAATGDNFNWYFQYPGPDNILGTEDDQYSTQNLYLPDHAEITLKLASNDYLYSFALPEMGLKEIAAPDLYFELNFNTGNPQILSLLGDQFCGFAHDSLKGKVHILDQTGGFYKGTGFDADSSLGPVKTALGTARS